MFVDEDTARTLARENPEGLIGVLRDENRDPVELFFAAEFAGQVNDQRVIEPLLALLRHSVTVVREGAARGLAWFVHLPEVKQALQRVMESDLSPAVRAAAADSLDE